MCCAYYIYANEIKFTNALLNRESIENGRKTFASQVVFVVWFEFDQQVALKWIWPVFFNRPFADPLEFRFFKNPKLMKLEAQSGNFDTDTL
jgi:hypothetical protein